MVCRTISLLIAISFLAPISHARSFAADGTLQIRFLLDGEPPKPTVMPAPVGLCAKGAVDERVVLGPK